MAAQPTPVPIEPLSPLRIKSPTASPRHMKPPAAPLQAFVADAAALAASSHLPNQTSLARQVLHNLAHQHHWSALNLHTHSPLTHAPLPRPLVSGLPPQRLYVHPDEQVELLKKAGRERKARADDAAGLDLSVAPEREWVLPTRLNEKWTLRRLAAVFDGISILPPAPDSDEPRQHADSPFRATKRVLLGTVDTDSTVVYYIIHDGVVKPRQN